MVTVKIHTVQKSTSTPSGSISMTLDDRSNVYRQRSLGMIGSLAFTYIQWLTTFDGCESMSEVTLVDIFL